MSERYDFIAINARGVYGLCEDIPGDPGRVAADFIARAHNLGHRVERVPVAESVDRHLAYLKAVRAALSAGEE